MGILLKNGVILNESSDLVQASVLVEDGKIAKIAPTLEEATHGHTITPVNKLVKCFH